jgi:hypothetical protein
MRNRNEKKQVKQKKQEKQVYSSTVNDIISKIRDTQSAADKKLEELSRICLDKACRLKG